jgi:hypothetical protein
VKVTEIEFDLDLDAADNIPLIIQPPRTPGLHASDIYGGLAQEIDPERYPKGSKPHTIIMAVGLAWEQWLERTLIGMGELVVRPGELVSPEGIIYSPDLLVINGKPRTGEIKTTCMTAKDGIEGPKFDKYHAQAMLYCHWNEMPDARFYALFLRGDYKFMKKGHDRDDDGFPELHVYDVSYSAYELLENYQTHMAYAKRKRML